MLIVRKQRTLGAVVGLVLPVAAFFLSYWHFGTSSLPQYVQVLITPPVMLSKVASLCVVPNLVAFFAALLFGKDSVAFGILAGTVVMAFVVAGLYFVF